MYCIEQLIGGLLVLQNGAKGTDCALYSLMFSTAFVKVDRGSWGYDKIKKSAGIKTELANAR